MAKTILLADDSVTIQKVVELTFLGKDYRVIGVGDGTAAMTQLPELRPDLVIADVHMPGADGYAVCRKSKETYPQIPVLLLVGTFEHFDETKAAACGAEDHLKKPFDSKELLKKVETLLAGSGGSGDPTLDTVQTGIVGEAASPPETVTLPSEAPASQAAAPPAAAPPASAPPELPGMPDFAAPPTAPPVAPDPSLATVQASSMPQPPSVETEPSLATIQASEMPASFGGATPMPPADGTPDESDEAPLPLLADEQPATEDESAAPAPPESAYPVFDGPIQPAAFSGPIQPAAMSGGGIFEESAPETAAPPPVADPSVSSDLAAAAFAAVESPKKPTDTPSAQPEPDVAAPVAADAEPTTAAPMAAETTADETTADEPVAAPQQAVTAAEPQASEAGAAEAPSAAMQNGSLSDEDVDRIARRLAELLSEQVLREVAWEVVPDLAEVVIKERIRQLESEIES